ncbi:glucosamine-6-phosphate deaminase [Granulicella cerasi]|uniref:Glucosamine-6-phosphate deaminase n=1 Tax=Granulicella cerasi TaxID=741063 RepID=A0ABW1Z9X8_9BACT|nr:glucosamine-6-phosphate deaminase [Granulicella cerasi]
MIANAEEQTIIPFIAPNRDALGVAAAQDVATELRHLLQKQATVRVVFAAAPSQSSMLAALCAAPDIEWTRVVAFHMDEYIGLPEAAPQRFGNFLRRHIFDLLPFAAVNLLDTTGDPEVAATKYAALLHEAPIDIVLCGIGTNGHLAFNDPPADFNDAKSVKVVELDLACRQQQVDDECFDALAEVPHQALTLTVPRLMKSGAMFCSVPGAFKREAVQQALEGPLTETCPASILRQHPRCKVYLDEESASLLSR